LKPRKGRWTRRPDLRLVLWVVSRPVLTLVVATVLIAASVVGAIGFLQVSTDQNKQFSDRAPFFRAYLDFIEKFPENEAIYVVMEQAGDGPPPPVERWVRAADAIERAMHAIGQHVVKVHARVPVSELGELGLVFESPEGVREAREGAAGLGALMWALTAPQEIPRSGMSQNPVARFLTFLYFGNADPRTAMLASLVGESLERAFSGEGAALTPGEGLPDLAMLDASDPSRLGYFFVPDRANPGRHILLVRVYPQRDFTSMSALSESVEAMRAGVRSALTAYPEFRAGVTGRPALEADELRTTNADARLAEIIALSTVFVGLMLLLRSLWLAVVADIGLGVGIGLTFGWATISVGELNLLSMVFLLALIGIGIDYFTQIVARYPCARERHAGTRARMVAVYRHVSAPIATTCAGASCAFFVSVVTDFKGAAELGIIAGGGLILCLTSAYTVVPALLTLRPGRRSGTRGAGRRGADMGSEGTPRTVKLVAETPGAKSVGHAGRTHEELAEPSVFGRTHARLPLLWPAAWLVLVVLCVPLAWKNRFDPGLLSLQSKNLESVQLVRRLDTWFSVVLSDDLDLLRRVRAAVEGLPTVQRTESLLDAIDRREWLLAQGPPVVVSPLPAYEWTSQEVYSVASSARMLAERFEQVTGDEEARRHVVDSSADMNAEQAAWVFARASRAMRGAAEVMEQSHEARGTWAAQRMKAWHAGFVEQWGQIAAMFTPPPVEASALPEALGGHLVSADGTYALYIHPREDLWDQAALARFVIEVEEAVAQVPGAPRPTGIAPNIHEATAAVERSFYTATALALGIIVLLVLADLRRVRDTLLAISVLGLGLPVLVGVMGLLGVSWNFANFFGLPILIGAGHEYGVFLVHRYREALRDPRRGWPRWDVSDKALLLCAFATSASFGFFWAVAHHEGLRSLGLVMALGIACIYSAGLVALRPYLRWRLTKA
jgi:predicted RND superfamily exporter protein